MSYNNASAESIFPLLSSPLVSGPARILEPLVAYLSASPLMASAEVSSLPHSSPHTCPSL
jgi:hypothetical protein